MSPEERKAMRRRKTEAANYEVGYGKPPKATQFSKGKSGNPRGRPRGSKNKPRPPIDGILGDIILDEANRLIPVTEGGRQVDMPMVRTIIRSINVKAAKGDRLGRARLILNPARSAWPNRPDQAIS